MVSVRVLRRGSWLYFARELAATDAIFPRLRQMASTNKKRDKNERRERDLDDLSSLLLCLIVLAADPEKPAWSAGRIVETSAGVASGARSPRTAAGTGSGAKTFPGPVWMRLADPGVIVA